MTNTKNDSNGSKIKKFLCENLSGWGGVPCIILILAYIFLFLTNMYNDQISNISQSMPYAWALFDGTFFKTLAESSASYGFTIYLIYALWGLPICIIYKIAGLDISYTNVPYFLWFKLLLVVLMIFSIYIIQCLISLFADDKKKEISWIYASSMLVAIPIAAICQCDIMSLCFVLLGVYYYIKDKNIRFFIFFVIAMTMKFFAVLIFIPLVLLKWKSLWRLLAVMGAGGLAFAVIMAIQFLMPGSSASWSMGSGYYVAEHVQRFNGVSLDFGHVMGEVGLFGLAYGLVCIAAFAARVKEDDRWPEYVIWFVMAAYFTFFLFYATHIYWYILIAPFLLLSAYINQDNELIVSLLTIVFEIYFLIKCCVEFYWVFFTPGNLTYLIFKNRFAEFSTTNLLNTVMESLTGDRHFINNFFPLIQGVGYAAAFAIIYFTYPGRKRKAVLSESEEKDNAFSIRILAWIRPLILLAICLIELVAVFVWR